VSDKQRESAQAGRPARPDRGSGRVPGDVLLVLRIVHAALVASILLFGAMLVMVTRPPGDPVVGASIPVRAEPPAVLTPIMAGLAAASLLGVALVRRRMARQRAGQLAAPARIYSASIVSWTLTESIAIDGLVLGIIHRDPVVFVPFGAVSLIVMAVLAPRRSHLQ
jgi:hypothetical protein